MAGISTALQRASYWLQIRPLLRDGAGHPLLDGLRWAIAPGSTLALEMPQTFHDPHFRAAHAAKFSAVTMEVTASGFEAVTLASRSIKY